MRIVHTSDWHAGKVWKRVDRTPELVKVLDHLARFVASERVDLVLVTGDLFDNAAPRAEAERAVFRFFRDIGRAGAKSVVIAGNHDHPARVDAWGLLAELSGVLTVGRLRPIDRLLEVTSRAGELALVGAVPFTPMGKFVAALDLAADEGAARQTYATKLSAVFRAISERFRPDAVNLIAAHTDVDGALRSGVERSVHLGTDWAMTPQAVPPNASYVALGHIHAPQAVPSALSPTRYAGSPLQLDFGEVGEAKSFVFIEAKPGAPVTTSLIPYEGGTALVDVRASLVELERDAARHASAGWLRVTVPLDSPDPEVSAKVRRLLPNALVVRGELPERLEEGALPMVRTGASPLSLFEGYLARTGLTPPPGVLEAFAATVEEVEV